MLPTIVGVSGLVSALKDGQFVEMGWKTGTIEIIGD
jgi:hypothetical protein